MTNKLVTNKLDTQKHVKHANKRSNTSQTLTLRVSNVQFQCLDTFYIQCIQCSIFTT